MIPFSAEHPSEPRELKIIRYSSLLAGLNLVDFHAPRIKQQVQNALWKRRLFRTLQFVTNVASAARGWDGRKRFSKLLRLS